MSAEFSDNELEAWLDESLDASRAIEIEKAVREDAALMQQLAAINQRRDAGLHTIGGIWRQHQIGVPDAELMGKWLLGIATAEQSDYIEFRIETLKCPYTIALQEDLENQRAESPEQQQARRGKIYNSSEGLLPEGE